MESVRPTAMSKPVTHGLRMPQATIWRPALSGWKAAGPVILEVWQELLILNFDDGPALEVNELTLIVPLQHAPRRWPFFALDVLGDFLRVVGAADVLYRLQQDVRKRP